VVVRGRHRIRTFISGYFGFRSLLACNAIGYSRNDIPIEEMVIGGAWEGRINGSSTRLDTVGDKMNLYFSVEFIDFL